jgi:hypothetical protein
MVKVSRLASVSAIRISLLQSDPDPDSDGLELIGQDIGSILARSFALQGHLHTTDENTSPRRRFFHWLESRVIAQRFKADPEAVIAVADSLKKVIEELATRQYDDQNHDGANRFLLQRYFLELPERIQEALELDPEVMAQLGLTTFESVIVGSLCFERTEYLEAAGRVLHGQEGRVNERTLGTEYTLIATRDSQTGQRVIEFKNQKGIVVETSHDAMMELLLDDPKARQEWLRLHRLWFDCNTREFEKIAAEITSTEQPLKRVEKARAWLKTSAAVFYIELEQQLKNTGRFIGDDLLPPSAISLLRHFRLGSLMDDDADFQDCLQLAASNLIAEEGLESAISRLGCLPVKLPAVCAEACDNLTDGERQQLFEKLATRWASPVYKLHLVDLVLRYARDNTFCLDLARSTLAELFDETTGTAHYRLFEAILSFVNDEFGYWSETASWPASVKLAMTWTHTSRLHNIFVAVYRSPDQLTQWFERVQHPIVSAEILGREPAFWDDVLHPRRVKRRVLLTYGVAVVLADHDAKVTEQLGVRNVILNTGFPEVNGSRSPHIDLLHDSGLARNVLESFFGGNHATVLASCLGSELANTLASSSFQEIVKQAVQNLKAEPCQKSEWAKIGMIVGGLPMYEELLPEFRELLDSLDFGALIASDPETATIALHVAIDQIVRLTDENLRSRCRAGLLEIARSQAHDDSYSTHNIAAGLLLDNALKLSIYPGDLRRTSETFAKLVQEIFNSWPRFHYRTHL